MIKIRVKKGFIYIDIDLLNEYALCLFYEPYKTHKTKVNTNIQIRKLLSLKKNKDKSITEAIQESFLS